ncbi:hypothetical protein BH10BAC6_BH10BAC6_05920 [soil metagenome]
MRTFAELLAAAEQAARQSNVAMLDACCVELAAMDSDNARALRARARGQISYIHADFDAALQYYSEALGLYEQLQEPTSIAGALGNIGSVHFSMGSYQVALDSFARALAVHESIRDNAGIARITNNIALVHTGTGDYPAALEKFHHALALHLQMEDKRGIAIATGNIGIVYNSAGNYADALSQFRKALDVYEQTGDMRSTAGLVGNIGNVYNTTGDYATALTYYQRSYTLHEQLGNRSGMANVLGNMGNAYLSMEAYEQAQDHMERSIALCTDNGELASAIATRGNLLLLHVAHQQFESARDLLATMATMHIDEPTTHALIAIASAQLAEHDGNIPLAVDVLRTALAEVTRVGLKKEQADLHKRIRDFCQRTNDFAGYIVHNDEHTKINEEINGKDVSVRLAMQEKQREIDEKDREVQKQLAVLHSTLPKHIADRVARGEAVNDHFDNATVMCLDIVGFTTMSAQMSPQEVITMLEGLFGICDECVNLHGLMKIKTIGDSYMAVNFESTVDAVLAALDILQRVSDAGSYACRIGLHCGPVIAGVIGKERLQYDIWGDAVNVAARMEQTCEPGRIQCSEAVATQLLRSKEEYNVEQQESMSEQHIRNMRLPTLNVALRGEMEIKGKGRMRTYWLETG